MLKVLVVRQAMFQFKETPTNLFPDFFSAEVERFKEATLGMDQFKVLSLTEYPDTGASSDRKEN
jgi:hypothetical protein